MSERTVVHSLIFMSAHIGSYYYCIHLGMASLALSNRIFCFLIYLFVKTELSADPIIALQQLSPLELIAKAVPFVKGLKDSEVRQND